MEWERTSTRNRVDSTGPLTRNQVQRRCLFNILCRYINQFNRSARYQCPQFIDNISGGGKIYWLALNGRKLSTVGEWGSTGGYIDRNSYARNRHDRRQTCHEDNKSREGFFPCTDDATCRPGKKEKGLSFLWACMGMLLQRHHSFDPVMSRNTPRSSFLLIAIFVCAVSPLEVPKIHQGIGQEGSRNLLVGKCGVSTIYFQLFQVYYLFGMW